MNKRKRKSSKSSKTQQTTDLDNSSKMSLKLLVDKKGPRVLFAEAPKEFVDFLFHIFSLPLGTLIELMGSKQMVGCLGKLKDIIQNFNGNYLQHGITMDDIFNPKTPFDSNTFLLSYHDFDDDQSGACKAVYRCASATPRCCHYSNNICWSNATLYENSKCPNCSGLMNVKMTLVMPNEVAETKEDDKRKNKGYVKEVITYMVMDDLVVKPMSTISSITLINKFGVKSLNQLEEKMVYFGKEEGLKLLMASLKTDKVLTTIFMQ